VITVLQTVLDCIPLFRDGILLRFQGKLLVAEDSSGIQVLGADGGSSAKTAQGLKIGVSTINPLCESEKFIRIFNYLLGLP